MTKAIVANRIVALLGLAMAALVVLSALNASDAHAKKKRHHHRVSVPSINTVQCPNQPQRDIFTCLGTDGRDHLVGRDDEFDQIFGGEGDDTYDGKGGSDDWSDKSTTSNDTYLIPATQFSQLFAGTKDARLGIQDDGGNFDVLDLSAYKSTDFAVSRVSDLDGDGQDELRMEGAGARDIIIFEFFTTNSIDFLKFSNRTLTADQLKPDQG